MAKEELLRFLKEKGADAWNTWRESKLVTDLDLSGADLGDEDLVNVNLSGANLSGANLRGTNLSEAYLDSTDLSGAGLSGADLVSARLTDANICYADLTGTNLDSTDLRCTYLYGANLSKANLTSANLSLALCTQADFSSAYLAKACLIGSRLDGATLNLACLWETQRARWSIKGVICEAVYFDEERRELTSFGPGDFERLYSDKTKVVLFYKDGINSLEFSTLPALVKHLEQSHPGCSLRLESIKDAMGGAVVTLVIDDASDGSLEGLELLKVELEATAKQVIEFQRLALDERETRLQLEGEVKQLNSVVDKLIVRPSIVFHSGEGISMGDTYKVGQGVAGQNVHAHDMTFNQIGGQIEQSMDLTELARQLARLREAMSQDAKEPSHYIALGEVAKAEEAAKAKDSSKVAQSLKAAGKWALDVSTKIGVPLAIEAIKHSTGMK